MSRALTASVKRVASTDDLLYYLEAHEAARGEELALGFSEEFDAWVRETYEEGETDEDDLDEIIAGEDSRTLRLDLPDWVWEEWYESRAWEPALRADFAYAPSWYLMSDPEPFTGLAVHFTDAPEKVASQGFLYGVRDKSRLGLTRHLDDYDARPGYNFAYDLKDWKKYARKSDGTYRYGQGAVVFPVKGVSVWHSGDKERQVIFWGPDVRSGITPVVKTKGGWESRGQVYGDLESALDGFRFSQRLSAKDTSMSASVKRVASRYAALGQCYSWATQFAWEKGRGSPCDLSGLKMASEELPFDRFYKALDAIRKQLRSARDHRDLDLAAEHIPVYVRGGVSKGFLPKSYGSKYNRLLRGSGLAGLSGVDDSRDHWLSIVNDMEKSARRKERAPKRTPKKKWDWREYAEEIEL